MLQTELASKLAKSRYTIDNMIYDRNIIILSKIKTHFINNCRRHYAGQFSAVLLCFDEELILRMVKPGPIVPKLLV